MAQPNYQLGEIGDLNNVRFTGYLILVFAVFIIFGGIKPSGERDKKNKLKKHQHEESLCFHSFIQLELFMSSNNNNNSNSCSCFELFCVQYVLHIPLELWT